MFSGTVEAVDGGRVTLRVPSGEKVEASTGEAEVRVGQEAHVAVRPEKVRFGGEGDNVMTVKIHQVVYLGVSTQYIADLPGGEKLILYQQNTTEEEHPQIGDDVRVLWDARNCLILGG